MPTAGQLRPLADVAVQDKLLARAFETRAVKNHANGAEEARYAWMVEHPMIPSGDLINKGVWNANAPAGAGLFFVRDDVHVERNERQLEVLGFDNEKLLKSLVNVLGSQDGCKVHGEWMLDIHCWEVKETVPHLVVVNGNREIVRV